MASSHLSSNWLTVALDRLNLPASTSATSADSALPAARCVPWNERVAWRGLPLFGSRPMNARSPQWPGDRSRMAPGWLFVLARPALPDTLSRIRLL